jgi:predicted RNase H-like nuclease (RuvC/YqgF family)
MDIKDKIKELEARIDRIRRESDLNHNQEIKHILQEIWALESLIEYESKERRELESLETSAKSLIQCE